MQRMSARDAKNGFGKLIDLARAEPVAIEKYGRSVVVVMAVEEYERLSGKSEKQRSGTTPAKGNGAKP
jgi:prevent-host-death family protein